MVVAVGVGVLAGRQQVLGAGPHRVELEAVEQRREAVAEVAAQLVGEAVQVGAHVGRDRLAARSPR